MWCDEARVRVLGDEARRAAGHGIQAAANPASRPRHHNAQKQKPEGSFSHSAFHRLFDALFSRRQVLHTWVKIWHTS
jgi:hypothetical protein